MGVNIVKFISNIRNDLKWPVWFSAQNVKFVVGKTFSTALVPHIYN